MGGAAGAKSGIMPAKVKGRAERLSSGSEPPSPRPAAPGDCPRPAPAASQPSPHPAPAASSLAGLASRPPRRPPWGCHTSRANPSVLAARRGACEPPRPASPQLPPSSPVSAQHLRLRGPRPLAAARHRVSPVTCAPARAVPCGKGCGRGGGPSGPRRAEPGPWRRGGVLRAPSGASPVPGDRTVGGRPGFVDVVSTGSPAPSAPLASALDPEREPAASPKGTARSARGAGGGGQGQVSSAARQLCHHLGICRTARRRPGHLRPPRGPGQAAELQGHQRQTGRPAVQNTGGPVLRDLHDTARGPRAIDLSVLLRCVWEVACYKSAFL